MLYMTTTDIKAVTLLDLAEDPGTPVPYWIGGKPGRTEVLGDAAHVRRLVEWATFSAFSEHTRVEITGYHVSPRSPYSPLMTKVAAELTTPAMHSHDLALVGWNVQITPPGLPPRDLIFWFEGYIADRGTKQEQQDAWNAHAAKQMEHVRQVRAKDGHGLLDKVARTTREREDAQKAASSTDTAWREAVKGAMVGGESATEVARLARISRERAYQIKDDRR